SRSAADVLSVGETGEAWAALPTLSAMLAVTARATMAVRRRPVRTGRGCGGATGDELPLPFPPTGLADGVGLGRFALPRPRLACGVVDSPQWCGGSPVRWQRFGVLSGAFPRRSGRRPDRHLRMQT